jgi:RNA polymerase sigma-70 factor (ECF subfamily)
MAWPGKQATPHAERFARLVQPHLPAAYRLALWLLRDPAAAEDVVQDAAERALRNMDGFRGGNERAWVLRIVRNRALDTIAGSRPTCTLDEDMPDNAASPEAALGEVEGRATLLQALALLPATLRECVVLRELEECSYREIADIAGIPIGTVMSRLWKGRQMLMQLTQGLRA